MCRDPGGYYQGETLEEARENIREAIEFVLESRREEKDVNPETVREELEIAV
jgi:predicted RNase H-like HicB family nuclease